MRNQIEILILALAGLIIYNFFNPKKVLSEYEVRGIFGGEKIFNLTPSETEGSISFKRQFSIQMRISI